MFSTLILLAHVEMDATTLEARFIITAFFNTVKDQALAAGLGF